MNRDKKRRQKHLRKTKAELVDKLEALETEIAELKRGDGGGAVQNVLLESEGPLQAFFDNSPTAIFVRDVEGRYRFVNRAYEEWFKSDRNQILGKTPRDLFKRETADRIIAYHRDVLKAGTRIEREVETSLQDGTKRIQWVIQFPLLDQNKKAIGICGILTDLTERKQAEEAIRKSGHVGK